MRLTATGGLDSRGVIVDFGDFKTAWEPVKNQLDHRNLNDLFGAMATAECIAIYIYAQVKLRLPVLSAVELWEGDKNMARVAEAQ